MSGENVPEASATHVAGLPGAKADSPAAAAELQDVTDLLRRMRGGDRAAAALFVTRYGSRIRRRIHGKLGPGMRSMFDSQDILSTLGRRLDRVVRMGRLEAETAGELWAFVFGMAERVVREKVKVYLRLRQCEFPDGGFAQEVASRDRQVERDGGGTCGIDLQAALACLEDPADRQVLSLWFAGTRPGEIATKMGLTPSAITRRWERIRLRLQARLESEVAK